MIMFRRTHRAVTAELLRLAEDRQRELRELQHANVRGQVELALTRQARDKAERDANYWRTRAEKFIDQVGLRERIIATPTMTEDTPAPQSSMDSVFSALGHAEINTKSRPAGPASTGPAVTGVDTEAAKAAVADLLERVTVET